MIPLRDINPRRGSAFLTYALIAANIAVFVHQMGLDPHSQQAFILKHGLVPRALLSGTDAGSWSTPISSMFMHGGFMHIIGNMWFLHVFGDNIEDTLGKTRFLIIYFATGLAAALAQVASNPDSAIPMVGASGAVSGIIGAYMVLFPKARIVTILPIFIFIQFIELPAIVFSFIWFGYQLLMGAINAGGPDTGGVAFFAHIGGFLAGLVLTPVLKIGRRR